MIKVVYTIKPENNMDITDIGSFETENYIGIYDWSYDKYALIFKSDTEFSVKYLDEGGYGDMQELDDAVMAAVGEHIVSVSDTTRYKLEIVENV